MLTSIYLHNDVAELLKYYGKLDDVINKMLKEIYERNIDIRNTSNCPDRSQCKRVTINVTYEPYINEIEVTGIKNKELSLSRIIYFFVENEFYNEFKWEIVKQGGDKEKILSYLKNAELAATRLKNKGVPDAVKIIDIVNEIRGRYE